MVVTATVLHGQFQRSIRASILTAPYAMNRDHAALPLVNAPHFEPSV
ncbi:hypothetical protein MARINOS108_20631 [Marinoscillum sp. 108]|nr:hypothetical protein MARINOS108_20631 [Marinoscillum sp. 108]